MSLQNSNSPSEETAKSPEASTSRAPGGELTTTMTDWVVLVVIVVGGGVGAAYYFGAFDGLGTVAGPNDVISSSESNRDIVLQEFSLPDIGRLHESGQKQIQSQHQVVEKLVSAFNEDRVSGETRTQLGEAFGLLGQLLHVGQFPKPAAVCYANAEELLPNDFRWPYLHARMLLKDDAKTAKSLFERACVDLEANKDAKKQQLISLWYWLGTIERNEGEFEQARSAFQKSLGHNQKAFAVWLALGQMETEAGRPKAAIQALTTAQRLLPEQYKHFVAYPLGLAYRQNGQEELAKRYLERGRTKAQRMTVSDPLWRETLELLRTPSALSQRAIRLLDRGRLQQAEELLREAIALDPENGGLRNNLAGLLLMRDRTDEAQASFTKAIELNPKLISAHRGLAAIATKRDNLDTTMRHLQIAIEIDSTDRSVLVDLGRIHQRLKEYDKALEFFDVVLKLDPGNPDATLGRQLALSEMKKTEK